MTDKQATVDDGAVQSSARLDGDTHVSKNLFNYGNGVCAYSRHVGVALFSWAY